MIDLYIVFSVCLGGLLTLLGTLLANYLQYRSEERKLRKARTVENLKEIRRYLVACLDFADSVSIPTTYGINNFGGSEAKEWIEIMTHRFNEWKSLPASGSARVLYTADEEILKGLKQIDQIRVMFLLNYQAIIHGEPIAHLDSEREDLKRIAAQLNSRLDELFG